MTAERQTPVMIIAAETELPMTERVWGTGEWNPARDREALDWLTLCRCMGWNVAVTHNARSMPRSVLDQGTRSVIIACNPDAIGPEIAAGLGGRLAVEPLLIVTRAPLADTPLVTLTGVARRPEVLRGRSLFWHGPGQAARWRALADLEGCSLIATTADVETWLDLDHAPVAVARRIGCGVVLTFALHPSESRDTDAVSTNALKHLLVWGSPQPAAWLDLGRRLVLRMDDPGGSQNVHLESFAYQKLGEDQWTAVAHELRRRHARMSIAYVSGWVDDGDRERGDLTVSGRQAKRVPGFVHDSPFVQYRDRCGTLPGTLHDYSSEYRGIQIIRQQGLGDVELHGYTHIHPDLAAWAAASDRHSNVEWFRELGRRAAPVLATRPWNEQPLVQGLRALRNFFGTDPTTLVCPGDDFVSEVIESALDAGLEIVSSWTTAIRDAGRYCWITHMAAPYLDEPNPYWAGSGVPAVGYFHDRDVALNGPQWLAACLDRWVAAGIEGFMDFRELASILGRRVFVESDGGDLVLHVDVDRNTPLVRPLPVHLKLPDAHWPGTLRCVERDGCQTLGVEVLAKDLARVTIPVQPGTQPVVLVEDRP